MIWQQCGRSSELYFYCLVFKLKPTFLSNMRPPSVASWGARPGVSPPPPPGNTADHCKEAAELSCTFYIRKGEKRIKKPLPQTEPQSLPALLLRPLLPLPSLLLSWLLTKAIGGRGCPGNRAPPPQEALTAPCPLQAPSFSATKGASATHPPSLLPARCWGVRVGFGRGWQCREGGSECEGTWDPRAGVEVEHLHSRLSLGPASRVPRRLLPSPPLCGPPSAPAARWGADKRGVWPLEGSGNSWASQYWLHWSEGR